jgi:hypothetical protein
MFLKIIMLRCIFKNIPKYVIKKYFQIVFLVSKLFLSCFYATLYFSFIKLIPNFYDIYIIYSQ